MNSRYRQDELVGTGGAGAVYKGFDTQLQRVVAIKRLLIHSGVAAQDSGTQGSPESLLQEAKTLSAIQHPNIVTVHDIGLDDQQNPFVVMEFINGETLDDLVRRNPMTESDFRILATDSLEALIAAHSRGLLHRDIKPGNFMMEWLSPEKFQVKLLDFGLAKLSRVPVEQTIDQEGAVMGSIYYMAPEQFERTPLDCRTDLYSLGATFYYALTGRNAFNAETGPEVMAAHMNQVFTPLSEQRPDLSPQLCAWVESLMRRRPEERFQTAKEALEALTNAQIPTPTVEKKESKSNALGLAVGILAIAALLVGLLVLTQSDLSPSQITEVVETPMEPQLLQVSPFDLSTIGTMIGQSVRVEGEIVRAGQSKSGKTRYLNFSNRPGTSISIGFRVSSVGQVFPMTRLENLVGKQIEVVGQISEVYGDLLVFVEDDAQLTEVAN